MEKLLLSISKPNSVEYSGTQKAWVQKKQTNLVDPAEFQVDEAKLTCMTTKKQNM